ncbi:UBX domain-containing protein 7 [Anopheles nili]|uniref:UBX domain-containing protein 7 n=1 Tax=Anopheles nili TaxID=185578 RepID=UPI00237BF135|nr:UBX domain-containing protein 7 [Anopheles nili]
MANNDNVKALTEITGLKDNQALNLLTAYNYNLEAAINAFFENPEGILNPEPAVVIDDEDSGSGPSSGSNRNAIASDDNVRAPIPRKTEILLPQIEVNRARLGKRRGAIITEVPFRNFELEGRIQEQMLMQQGQGPSAKKVTRLEALFMPPFEIMFSGGFDQAQRHGNTVDRWLLVNLQDDLSFSCQTLNRDLWSDARLKEFMRMHLVFWQQSNKTTDGAKFKAFYKVHSEPYIGMIDPRTGEEVRNMSNVDLSPARFLDALKEFMIESKSPHGKEINVKMEYKLGMGPSTSANGSKSLAQSSAAGSSGQSSKLPQPNTTEVAGSSKNRWSAVIDDDEDDFQEITDSESDSEENDRSRPAGDNKSTRNKTAKDDPVPTTSAAALPVRQKDVEDDHAKGSNSSKDEEIQEKQPWEMEKSDIRNSSEDSAVSPAKALSSDSESSLVPDQKTRILLKMPGNVTERLFFRSTRTLEQAMAKLREKYDKHFHPRDNGSVAVDVRFFCQAIKSDLSSLDPLKTLLELKIHPNAVIHVTTDD